MMENSRASIASSSELPYTRPFEQDVSSHKPIMYVTGTDPTTSSNVEEHLGYLGNGNGHSLSNHHKNNNDSQVSLTESYSSQASLQNGGGSHPYRAPSRHRRREYSNSEERLNERVNFSKPVRPSGSNRNGYPTLQVSVPPSPSVSTTALAHGKSSHSPATPTSSAVAAVHHNADTSSSAQDENITPESLLVQQTYARIDEIGGIPGDGFVAGVELTRERRTQASINGYLDPLLAASWGPSSSVDRLSDAPGNAATATGRRKSEGASTSLLSVPEAGLRATSSLARSTNDRGRKVSAASRAASSKAPEEEEAELKLLERTDRYGFFTPAHLTTTSGRLVLLSKGPCMDLPKKALTSKSKSKTNNKKKAAAAAANGDTLASPYINLPPGSSHPHQDGSRNNSPRASLQPPSSNQALSTSTSLSSLRSLTGAPLAQSVNSTKEPTRILKWYDEMLVPARRDGGGNVAAWKLSDEMRRDEDKLQRRIRKGIPDRWRLAGWEALLARMREKSGKGPELAVLERRFYELILEPCQHDVQIDLDVPRTISGHLYFHTRYGLGQRALFNVLHAFALYCPECGYCQGMGSLAATFLCYMLPEKVYAAMVYLHDSYNMHTIFSPGFPGMLECFHAQEELTKVLMPDVAEIFDRNYISVTSFGTKWYITLFVNVLPFSTQLRVWDLFLYGGKDALILTSTAIIWTLKAHITKKSADFETILSLLSSFFVPEDEDAFIRWIGKMLKRKDVRDALDKWKADFREQEKKQR